MQKICGEKKLRNGKSVLLIQGDISDFVGDTLIIPTNPAMSMTQGCGKKIVMLEREMFGYKSSQNDIEHDIQKACAKWIARYGDISAEKPAYIHTTELPFQTVILTVLPSDITEPLVQKKSWDALVRALDLADLLGIHSAAIPTIPNWNIELCANLLIRGSFDYLKTRDSDIHSIHLLVDSDNERRIYQDQFDSLAR